MFKNLAKWVAKRALKYAGVPLRDPALKALFGQNEAYSGVDVNEETALNFSAVYSAVTLIASSVGILPKHIYKLNAAEGSDGVEVKHDVEALMRNPNPYMTEYVFTETLQSHACTWGNGYALIQRESRSSPRPIALWPVDPSKVTIHGKDEEDTYYIIRDDNGEETDVEYMDMLHLPGLCSDGRRGYSVVGLAREAIGLGLATEKYGASYFGEGATPRLVISHPGDLTQRAKNNLRKSWKEIYSNSQSPHGVAVLDEGMKVDSIGLPPEDSQFLQTRQFQIVEIARWFRVPPHMLYDLSQSTFNNIEQQNINFLTFTLLPWLVRWKLELMRKLFVLGDYARFYLDFDTNALLLTDINTRYTAYNTGRNGGWLTLNNILRKERLPLLPADIGDKHIAPSTMKILGASDPSTPIDVEVIQGTTELLRSLAKPNKLVSTTLAENIIKATMPGATEQFTLALILQLRSEGVVANAA